MRMRRGWPRWDAYEYARARVLGRATHEIEPPLIYELVAAAARYVLFYMPA